MAKLLCALDQGTQSTRAILYRADSLEVVASHQLSHAQLMPQNGWVEHDPEELVLRSNECLVGALAAARSACGDVSVLGLGITNQRETTLVWSRSTGKPLCNAVVWLDTRTSELCARLCQRFGRDAFRRVTGLPVASYFSAYKLLWLMEHVPAVSAAVAAGDACFGTVDSWLIYSLTGGGAHVTDVTNASRTGLMSLRSCTWDAATAGALGVPLHVLPAIRSSAEVYGHVSNGPLAGVPICGCLGDQQAATLGQRCDVGEAKATFGTGAFVVLNTGGAAVFSQHGLITTVAFQLGPAAPPVYALEGSVAIAGAGVAWLQQLGVLSGPAAVQPLAASVPDTAGVVLVPAFNGLLAPHWREDARGLIVGLTQFTRPAHLARAMLEAIAFQTREVLDAMRADAAAARLPGSAVLLRVDGGASANDLLLQLQADLLGAPVLRPADVETTALGAALAAGCALRLWEPADLFAPHQPRRGETEFAPAVSAAERDARYAAWRSALARSLCWTAHPPPLPRYASDTRLVLAALTAGVAVGVLVARLRLRP